MLHVASLKNIFIGRLEHGSDLLDELNKICARQGIKLGRISGLGAVKKAQVAYYSQEKCTYQFITIDKPLEILSLTGNISLKDGKPFVHVHIVLSDENAKVYGGHLAQGTVVFACEITIDELQGTVLERAFDSTTQLALWTNS